MNYYVFNKKYYVDNLYYPRFLIYIATLALTRTAKLLSNIPILSISKLPTSTANPANARQCNVNRLGSYFQE